MLNFAPDFLTQDNSEDADLSYTTFGSLFISCQANDFEAKHAQMLNDEAGVDMIEVSSESERSSFEDDFIFKMDEDLGLTPVPDESKISPISVTGYNNTSPIPAALMKREPLMSATTKNKCIETFFSNDNLEPLNASFQIAKLRKEYVDEKTSYLCKVMSKKNRLMQSIGEIETPIAREDKEMPEQQIVEDVFKFSYEDADSQPFFPSSYFNKL
jgi:hypothetical protein